MHGLGNDYLYVFGEVPENIAELSITLSERHFGAGSDGMIYISDSDKADFRMRIFNADGSEAMMCGNGIRCVGKYVYDKGYTDKTELSVETLSGIKYLKLNISGGEVGSVRVDMGKAYVSEDITLPVDPEYIDPIALSSSDELILTPVNVGNPHAVCFVTDAGRVPLSDIGPVIEHHPVFPDGVNTEFVQQINENELRMRVWERGSGITMACGTGACACTAAAIRHGMCGRNTPVLVHLDGGTLTVTIDDSDRVYMTGPCEFVYDAEYPAKTKNNTLKI